MYLKSLEIERFRAFRHTGVSFRYPGADGSGKLKYPNINLLLGNNGMGKSAALKAAALALMSPVISSTGYRAYSLARREVDKSPRGRRRQDARCTWQAGSRGGFRYRAGHYRCRLIRAMWPYLELQHTGDQQKRTEANREIDQLTLADVAARTAPGVSDPSMRPIEPLRANATTPRLGLDRRSSFTG